jgi:hypothetical protein
MGTPKAYSAKSVIFLEAPAFERIRERCLDDDQYQLLQAALMANPEAGVLIRGSGSLRKVRQSHSFPDSLPQVGNGGLGTEEH